MYITITLDIYIIYVLTKTIRFYVVESRDSYIVM